MNLAELDNFDDKCLDRVTTTSKGDYTELDIGAGAYRITVGFDRASHVVISSSVEPRAVERPPAPPPASDDEPDHEQPESQWEAAGTFLGKIASFGMAVASKAINGPVTGPAMEFRRQCCFGVGADGVKIGKPCPSMVLAKDGNNYCRSCGCGKRKRARLNPQVDGDWNTSKLAYPHLKCPRHRFGPISTKGADHA